MKNSRVMIVKGTAYQVLKKSVLYSLNNYNEDWQFITIFEPRILIFLNFLLHKYCIKYFYFYL